MAYPISTFIIAEAGVNHNGDPALARELVDVAAESGADAVKFQSFSADKLATRNAEKAEYQKRMTGEGSQYAMLKALEMSHDLHIELAERCAARDIEFMSTAFDEGSLEMLVDLGIKRIKVPSGELTNHPMLRHVASKDLPLIVSTGMAELQEIGEAVDVIMDERRQLGLIGTAADFLTILHCTSNYPAQYSDVNLRAMATIRDELALPVGYSDHTLGSIVSVSAVAMGASVVEKHFTLDKTMPGPDHAASLDPDELKAMVRDIRAIEAALGNGVKAPSASELPVRDLVRRSVTTTRALVAGTVIKPDDVNLMRPGTGIAPKHLSSVYGRSLSRDVPAGKTLSWEDIQ